MLTKHAVVLPPDPELPPSVSLEKKHLRQNLCSSFIKSDTLSSFVTFLPINLLEIAKDEQTVCGEGHGQVVLLTRGAVVAVEASAFSPTFFFLLS